MNRVTVYDVAEKAQVSISTVSRALNAPNKVSPPTRTRVLTAIDELGYVPKAEAVERARRRSGRIGVLAPFFTSPSFAERLNGVAAALVQSPYELTIYSVDSSARRDSYLTTLPVTRRLDGLIIMTLPFDGVAGQRLLDHGLETVLVEFYHESFTSIEIDNWAGGQLAAEYLVNKGHRRFGFVGDINIPDYAIDSSRQRLIGYRETLAKLGVPLPDETIALAPLSLEHARHSTRRLLALPDPPTAIFAASDLQAIAALKAARELGLSVPSDLAIIGFDDLDMAAYIGLTTIRQPLAESGRVAVDLLMSRLADKTRTPQRIRLPLTLMERETT